MKKEDIINKITELANAHHSTDEDNMAFMIEEEAENLIVEYCVNMGYLINGFPTEKTENFDEDFEEEDYYCRERYQLYLDTLALEKDDVAEIYWHYNESFWPGFIDKIQFLDMIKTSLENGTYDFEL